MAIVDIFTQDIEEVKRKLAENTQHVIINKFRKAILIDGTRLQIDDTDGKGIDLELILKQLKEDDSKKKIRLVRAYNDVVIQYMKDNKLTTGLIAAALGASVRKVERIMQGLEHAPDLRLVASIASLLCMSCGELIDLCYMRQKKRPFSEFLTSHMITERARAWIDKVMQGKRLIWWEDLKAYIYTKNKAKDSKL